MVNASNYFLKELSSEEKSKSIKESAKLNIRLLEKAELIVITKGSKKILDKYPLPKNYEDKLKIVLHPSIKNQRRTDYKDLWKTKNGLIKKLELEMEITI